MNKGLILVVDDEEEIRKSLEEILIEEGYRVQTAKDAMSAQAAAHADKPDAVLLDIKLGADDGLALLREFRENTPDLPVIMITGHGTVALAAEAFRLGAQDFLEKPLRLVPVRAAVRNAAERSALKKSLAEQVLQGREGPVSASPVMRDLFAQARKLAGFKPAVLVTGPSGSGKEIIARTLHFAGPRAAAAFVATNAASLPINLAEDELFGHEKGAFTGAHERRAGRVEEADGGTLFLDEVADMDMAVQAKLLRVIETGEVMRLGGGKPFSVDVRFVCATHKDLPGLIRAGRFREDLYYRLSGFVLRVPPLAERCEDILPLAERFLADCRNEIGGDKRFTEEAKAALLLLPLPGNVRELRHVISRACLFGRSPEISAADLRSAAEGTVTAPEPASLPENFSEAREAFEKSFLRRMLSLCNNNITQTANKIGMAQSNLSRKLKELGIR